MASLDLRNNGTRAMRRGRISETGQVYLLTFATSGRVAWFRDFALGCIVCRAFTQADLWRLSTLLAWVLMPDHWHGLVQLGGSDALSPCVARLKSAVTREVRRATGKPIRLWQDSFHDRALRGEEDLRAAARYLVLNPVRAGLVDSAWRYPFWDAVWVVGMAMDRR